MLEEVSKGHFSFRQSRLSVSFQGVTLHPAVFKNSKMGKALEPILMHDFCSLFLFALTFFYIKDILKHEMNVILI